MKLTKLQRHTAYIIMLEESYQKLKHKSYTDGLCCLVDVLLFDSDLLTHYYIGCDFIRDQLRDLVAPDGSWQGMTIAPDFQTCAGVIKLLHSKGLSKSFHELINVKGFQILPIKLTMIQMGDADAGFQWAKQKL